MSPDPIRTPGVFAVDPVESRLQTARVRPDDDPESSLRPRRLEEFVGQEALREQLGVSIQAASQRGEALDHVLLAGPPGLGKTSLAQIVAAELGVPFVQTAGPALERKADIAAFLTALEPRTVFFVDEIHRLPRAVEETFYPAMEDRQLPITVGAGAGARVVTLDLPSFTLVGATTRSGLLTTPLRDRFGIQHRLDHYAPGDLAKIVARSARVLEIEIEPAGARAIAERARGTPRVANRLLKRVRDFAEVRRGGVIDAAAAARRWTCSRSTTRAWTGWTARSSASSAASSAAGPSASPRSPWPCRRSPTRSRTSTSRTCSSAGSCSARRAGAAPPRTRSATSACARPRRRRSCSADRTCTDRLASDTWVSWPPASPAPG